jgi:hypothetical protein
LKNDRSDRCLVVEVNKQARRIISAHQFDFEQLIFSTQLFKLGPRASHENDGPKAHLVPENPSYYTHHSTYRVLNVIGFNRGAKFLLTCREALRLILSAHEQSNEDVVSLILRLLLFSTDGPGVSQHSRVSTWGGQEAAVKSTHLDGALDGEASFNQPFMLYFDHR